MAEHSAVLIGIYQDSIILTKRSSTLRTFTGHICLPGGGYENQLDSDFTMTAIREFQEEVNFNGSITPFMCLVPEFSPGAKHYIYPVVAKLDGEVCGFNQHEVEKIIYLRLSDLTHDLFKPNTVMPRIMHNWCFDYEDNYVWGLTAQILKTVCLYKDQII